MIQHDSTLKTHIETAQALNISSLQAAKSGITSSPRTFISPSGSAMWWAPSPAPGTRPSCSACTSVPPRASDPRPPYRASRCARWQRWPLGKTAAPRGWPWRPWPPWLWHLPWWWVSRKGVKALRATPRATAFRSGNGVPWFHSDWLQKSQRFGDLNVELL